MPRKTRRSSSSKKNTSLFGWPRVLIVIVPLFAAFLIMTNSSNGRGVLGISDTKFLNLNFPEQKRATNSAQKCKPNRISAFSLTGLCDSNRLGFKSASYTCEDGATGYFSKDCMNPQSAYEKALKACAKNTKCAKPELKKEPKTTKTPSTGSDL